MDFLFPNLIRRENTFSVPREFFVQFVARGNCVGHILFHVVMFLNASTACPQDCYAYLIIYFTFHIVS